MSYFYKEICRKAQSFSRLKTVNDLANLIKMPKHQLQLLALADNYALFSIPKPDKTFREIEAPLGLLKEVQKKINSYLQSLYFLHKTSACYGFVVSYKSNQMPRNILTNAQKHLGKDYLLNIDLKHFFHQINETTLQQVFYGFPFRFGEELSSLLIALCTRLNRLPMGAATSPSLSNWACIGLDNELLGFAKSNNICYTRYADDLSFSSNKQITETQFKQIEATLMAHRFTINYNKVKWFLPQETKEITGLQLSQNTVQIRSSFYQQLLNDISNLEAVINVRQMNGGFGKQEEKWLSKHKQQIEGKLNFIQKIMGKKHENYTQNLNKYFNVLEKEQEADFSYVSMSWSDFTY